MARGRKAETAKQAKNKSRDGAGTIAKRDDGRYTVMLSLGTGPDGQRQRRSTTCKTLEEAEAKLLQWKNEVQQKLDLTQRGMTMAALAETWYENCAARRLAPKTLRAYRQMKDLYIVPSLGTTKVTAASVRVLQGFIDARSRSGLSPTTVRHIKAALHGCFEIAVDWSVVGANPVKRVRTPKLEEREPTFLEPDQAKNLLRALPTERYGSFFAVMLGVGLRPGEVRGLRWRDVTLNPDSLTGRLTVSQQVQKLGKVYIVRQPKTKAGRRTITLPPFVVSALLRRREEQQVERDAAAKSGCPHPQEWCDLVFTGEDGLPACERYVVRKFHELEERIGNPHIRLYDLRHTCASILLHGGGAGGQGLPLKVVQELMGHTDPTVLLKVYAHCFASSKQEAADAMQQAIAS